MTTFHPAIILMLLSHEAGSSETTKTSKICQEMFISLSQCCADMTWDDQKKECVQCNPGFIGVNCSEPCPRGVFGRQCDLKCPQDCQDCHHITGECLTDQNTFVYSTKLVDSTTLGMMESGDIKTTGKYVQNTSVIIVLVTGGSLLIAALLIVVAQHIIMITKQRIQARFHDGECTLQNESPIYEQVNESQMLRATGLPQMGHTS